MSRLRGRSGEGYLVLDPRIYRMALILPALALVVLAFSLRSQPGALHSSLSPAQYNGASVATEMDAIADDPKIPTLAAGSSGDRRLAGEVATSLRAGGNFTVSTDSGTETTPQGARTLQDVVATRAGSLSRAGSIVVVASRDGVGARRPPPSPRRPRRCSSSGACSAARRCAGRSCSPRSAARRGRPGRSAWPARCSVRSTRSSCSAISPPAAAGSRS